MRKFVSGYNQVMQTFLWKGYWNKKPNLLFPLWLHDMWLQFMTPCYLAWFLTFIYIFWGKLIWDFLEGHNNLLPFLDSHCCILSCAKAVRFKLINAFLDMFTKPYNAGKKTDRSEAFYRTTGTWTFATETGNPKGFRLRQTFRRFTKIKSSTLPNKSFVKFQ